MKACTFLFSFFESSCLQIFELWKYLLSNVGNIEGKTILWRHMSTLQSDRWSKPRALLWRWWLWCPWCWAQAGSPLSCPVVATLCWSYPAWCCWSCSWWCWSYPQRWSSYSLYSPFLKSLLVFLSDFQFN